MFEAEFWVAIAFVIFLGVLGYAGSHRRVLDALDRRKATITQELDEAKGIRQEAEAVLRDANRKRQEVAGEIERILDDARAQAGRLMVEAKDRMEDFVRRGSQLAEAKIAQAEQQAVADVRAMVTEVAVSAAEKVLTRFVNGEVAERIFDRGVEAVKVNLGSSP